MYELTGFNHSSFWFCNRLAARSLQASREARWTTGTLADRGPGCGMIGTERALGSQP